MTTGPTRSTPSQPHRNAQAPSAGSRRAAWVLRLFARVEPGELTSVTLLTLSVFLLLCSYYLLKTAREPLILLHGGAEVKSYASAGQSLLLLVIIPAYAALAQRVGRVRLLLSVYGFFAVNLLLFVLGLRAGLEIGVPFYLWVGVFNNTAIAQLWSFANDIYTPEQGQRLFAILGIGSSVGALAGSGLAGLLAGLGPAAMMLTAAGVLVLCGSIVAGVDAHERRAQRAQPARERPRDSQAERERPRDNQAERERPPIEGPVLRVLLEDKYLRWIALSTFLLNCVNSNGEYLLDRTLLEGLRDGGTSAAEAGRAVARFKAGYFGTVNWLGVVLQLFAVSRVLRVLGVRRTLYVLPAVSFLSYTMMLVTPALSLIRLGKIAENSLDYSVQNTTRQALFLVGTRAEKYLGKTVIDTLVVRMGDVFSAVLVFSAGFLALPTRQFMIVNLALIVCWLFVLVALEREHLKRSRELGLGTGDHTLAEPARSAT